MQYWKKNEGGITDQTGGTVAPILVLGNYNAPFLIPNVSDTFTVRKPHQKQKKKEKMGGTEKQVLSLKSNLTQEVPLAFAQWENYLHHSYLLRTDLEKGL